MRRGSLLLTVCAGMLAATAGLAFGPTSARLAGFGGVGVAVAPMEGTVAMSINPGAVGLVKDKELALDAWRAYTDFGVADDYAGQDKSDQTAYANEFYGNLGGPVSLFGSWVYDDVNVEPFKTKYLMASLGGAGSVMDGMLNFGAEFSYWRFKSRTNMENAMGTGAGYFFDSAFLSAYTDADNGAQRYNLGPGYVGNFGFLFRAPMGFNAGLTYNTGDDDYDVLGEDAEDEFAFTGRGVAGIAPTLRAGFAFQPDEGMFMAGFEYVNVMDQDVDVKKDFGFHTYREDLTFDGHSQYHGYGEVHFDPVAVRAGIGYLDYESGTGMRYSMGATLNVGEHLGFDVFGLFDSVEPDSGDLDTLDTFELGVGLNVRA